MLLNSAIYAIFTSNDKELVLCSLFVFMLLNSALCYLNLIYYDWQT